MSDCGCQSAEPVSWKGSIFSIGKLQRQSPLPAGIYWLDVMDSQNQSDFAAWSMENSGVVRVLKTEHFDAIRWPDCPITEGECSPSRDWVKFQVFAPVKWNAVQFGFPNIIEQNEIINTSADTASEPDFSDNCDIGCQAEKVAIAGGVILGGVAIIVLVQSFRR